MVSLNCLDTDSLQFLLQFLLAGAACSGAGYTKIDPFPNGLCYYLEMFTPSGTRRDETVDTTLAFCVARGRQITIYSDMRFTTSIFY